MSEMSGFERINPNNESDRLFFFSLRKALPTRQGMFGLDTYLPSFDNASLEALKKASEAFVLRPERQSADEMEWNKLVKSSTVQIMRERPKPWRPTQVDRAIMSILQVLLIHEGILPANLPSALYEAEAEIRGVDSISLARHPKQKLRLYNAHQAFALILEEIKRNRGGIG